jgi:hypothetical protein
VALLSHTASRVFRIPQSNRSYSQVTLILPIADRLGASVSFASSRFAALTGMKVEAVQTGLSAANTLVLEFGSNFLLLLAGIVPWRQHRPVEPPPPAENPVVEIEAQIRAAIEVEQIAKAEAAKAEAKRAKSREYKVRAKAKKEIEAKAKIPKRRRRKRKPPKPPVLKLVR